MRPTTCPASRGKDMDASAPRQLPGDESIHQRVRSCTTAVALLLVGAFGCVAPVFAQTGNPKDAPVQLEWLALSPVLRLTNGWDDNVFHVSRTDGPTRDFTATFSPEV